MRSTATFHVKIAVSNAQPVSFQALSFDDFNDSDNVQMQAQGQYHFEPELSLAMQIEGASLRNAKTSLRGFLDMELLLNVDASTAGTVSGITEITRRAFSKTLVVGEVPIVIHGDFVLHGKYDITSQDALNIEQTFDIAYFFEAGFEYVNGEWRAIMSGQPSLSYRLNSGAKSELSTQLTLIPEIQIRLYETELGHIQVHTNGRSDIALEGEFLGLSRAIDDIAVPTEYSFTKLDATLASELKLKADLSAIDQNVPTWPQQSSDGLVSFTKFSETPMFALSDVNIQDELRFDLPNSCVVSARANILPSVTSNFADTDLHEWEVMSTHWELINADPASQLSIENRGNTSRVQAFHQGFSPLNLRLSGFNGMGAWAKQYQDLSFDYRDNNGDGVPDYWSSKYNISNLLTDFDNDGIIDSNEFQYCTFPNKQDSDDDGMPDGWEVSNNLDPILDDAALDNDSDARSNLQEYLDGSDPQIIDENQAPVVSVNGNQTVNELSTVSLIGSATDGGTIDTNAWEQLTGPLVALDNANVSNDMATSVFIAPSVTQETSLSFMYTATDNSGVSTSSEVLIMVLPVNTAPVAVAGTDLSAMSGDVVNIDGQSSFDTDGSIEQYLWTSLDTTNIRFSDNTLPVTQFIAPEVVAETEFALELSVTDNEGAVSTDIINVQVSPNPELPDLSRVLLSELSDKVIIVRALDQDGRNISLAMLFTPLIDDEQSVNAFVLSERFNTETNQIESISSEYSWLWEADTSSLFLQNDVENDVENNSEPLSLLFADGSIDIGDTIASFGSLTNDVSIDNAQVSALYNRKTLNTNDLQGYSFTLLQNPTNQQIDFVTDSRAFIYDDAQGEATAVDWRVQNGQIEIDTSPIQTVSDIGTSFTSFDKLGDTLIINLSLMPTIDSPISELVFGDSALNTCVQNTAQSNDWLSVDEFTQLSCPNLNISNTQGIENLIALNDIDLSGNRIVNINLSQLSELETLNLTNNLLQSIDFSNNPLLQNVQLTNNNLSNASIAYLSNIAWIDNLSFDEVTAFPTGNDFIMQVTVEATHEFTIYTNDAFEYDFTVEWGDGNITTSHSEDASHTYTQAGAFEVKIYGTYPSLAFCEDNSGCSDFKLDILQWGSNPWQSMQAKFSGLSKINILADDAPDLREVENLSFMFYKASNFNSDISHWDISNVTDMNFMFGLATSFNGDLSQWNTSNVSNMGGLFYFAESFNGNISQWNTSSVTRMHSLFAFATSFNTDISQWNTSAVTQMTTMFLNATSFNGNLSLWDVGQVNNMNKMFFDATNMAGNLSNWNVSDQVTHRDFSHEGSLIIEPNWLN